MSNIQSQIINDLHNTTSDMSTIIGRYKGCVGVCVEEVREIASLPNVSGYAKQRLENLASVLENIVAENERLWENRGKRETSDIVQLERA